MILALGDDFSYHTIIFKWNKEFQRENFSRLDDERTGSIRTSATNLRKIQAKDS